MKNKRLDIDLLKLLEEKGLSEGMLINDFITSNFQKPDYNAIHYMGTENDDAYNFVLDMESRKYIRLNWFNRGEEMHRGSVTTGEFDWFDTIEVGSVITIAGLDYLYAHRLQESTLEVSKSTKRSFWTTLFLSTLTLGVSYATYNITRKQAEDVKQIKVSIDTLSLRPLQTELRILHQSIPKAFRRDSSRIQPPSVSNSIRKTN